MNVLVKWDSLNAATVGVTVVVARVGGHVMRVTYA